MKRILILAVLAGALLGAAACSGGERVSREEVLVSLTDSLIVPRFGEVAERMKTLRSSTRALCAQPSAERLEDARGAWRDAREPWLHSQAMWFGPIMDRRSRSLVDWWPVEPERIERTLSKRDSIDADIIREFLSSTQRGLGAMEYVMFQDDETVVKALEPGSIRCQYLTALADVIAEETAAALADWTGENAEGSSYAGYFNGTAKSSLIGKAAVDEAVRTSIFLSRIVVDMGLGKALGIDDSIPDISGIPGGAGHNQVADIRNQLLGMRDIYVGPLGMSGVGLGIGALVRGASAESDERVRAAFDSAIAAVEGLSEPLPSTIRDDPETARKAYDALKELQTTLNTDVVSVLGVTVGFADTDGDGG